MIVDNSTGTATFVNGQDIPVMNRTDTLIGTKKANLHTRRRPKYDNI
jgi:hypothetical protein